jgi:hypothetical protein
MSRPHIAALRLAADGCRGRSHYRGREVAAGGWRAAGVAGRKWLKENSLLLDPTNTSGYAAYTAKTVHVIGKRVRLESDATVGSKVRASNETGLP